MDTNQYRKEAPRPPSPRGRRSKTSLEWGPLVLAAVALVAVIAAAIWAVVPGDTRSGQPDVKQAPDTTSAVAEGDQQEAALRTIYLWDPNSGDVSEVFSTLADLTDAELSPDGERVVYERPDLDGRSQIYVRYAERFERQLTDIPGGASDPTWSPHGRRIAFSASPRPGVDPDIYVMGANGSHLRRLVGTEAADGDPDWSPDGSRIAFHGQSDSPGGRSSIWVASTETQALTRLTPRDVWGAVDPAWSPDGRWIAYSWYGGDTLNGRPYSAGLWRMRPDGSDARRMTQPDGNSVNENPSWSPDGRMIVFERHAWDWGRNRVVVIDPRTGRERPILTGAEADVPSDGRYVLGAGLSPSWGPDGILMSLPSGNPTPAPRPIPPALLGQENIIGVDATIRLSPGRGCDLDVESPIPSGRLKLEFVNDSRLDGYFRIVRLGPRETLSSVRANPGLHYWGRPRVFMGPSTSRVWSSQRRAPSGRWAVVCSKDLIAASNGFHVVPVGVAGPIEIEA